MSNEISSFRNKITAIFTHDYLQSKAVDAKFFRRSSKLTPAMFFEVLLYSGAHFGIFSLQQFCNQTLKLFGIGVTKQAFDDRITDNAVSFVKSVFEDLMKNQTQKRFDLNLLAPFNRVKIRDSTKFKVDKSLRPEFKGFGKESLASVCLQFEYDFKTGDMLELDIVAGSKADRDIAKERAHKIQKSDLDIYDLGYYDTSIFLRTHQAGAFFLSRLHTTSDVYDSAQGNKIDFDLLYQKMTKNQIKSMEMDVYVGSKEQFKVRLILDILPDHIYEERIRKKAIRCKDHGKTLTDRNRLRSRFNLLITNIDKSVVSLKDIYKLYQVRWQIELLFKVWKCTYGINRVHKMNKYRLRCLLYAKLILLLVNGMIINQINALIYQPTKRILSVAKCHTTLFIHIAETISNLCNKTNKGLLFFKSIAQMLSRNHDLEKRKNRQSIIDIIQLFACKSNN